jgi:hypothetical protein
MNILVKLAVAAALLVGFGACSGPSVEDAAADARDVASGARADVEDAQARVTAADAHVRVADAAVEAANADARVAANAVARDASEIETEPAVHRIEIPSGTVLKVSLIDALDSGTNSTGDRFLTRLSESIVLNGETVLERGTTIRGRVVEVEGAGRVTGLATIRFTLTDIVQDDELIPITTGVFAASSDSTQTRDAQVIAGTTAVGAAIGVITGGTKGLGIGAATGAGAGTGVVLATRGDEVRYGPETRFDFTLTNSVTI